MRKKKGKKPADRGSAADLDALPPLVIEGAPSAAPVKVVGWARSFGASWVALRLYVRGSVWALVDRAVIQEARALRKSTEGVLLEMRVARWAPAYLLVEPSPAGSAAAPFILATPHHVRMAYNPASIGGNIPAYANLYGGAPLQRQDTGLADPITLPEGQVPAEDDAGEEAGGTLGGGNTDWLKDTLTLPEGPADPPAEPPPSQPPPPPKATDLISDPITIPESAVTPTPPAGKGTDFMNDPLTIPEGAVGPPPKLPPTDWNPLWPPPPLPSLPWLDPASELFPFPGPGWKGTDAFSDKMTVPPYAEAPVAPEPTQTSPFWDFVKKGTGQFGDPWGLDWTFDW